jgi:hypothetical protein
MRRDELRVEIDNLNGLRKVFGDKISDPIGALADDHFFFARPHPRFDASRSVRLANPSAVSMAPV